MQRRADLGDRRKALEEEFFKNENQRLREKLRQKQEKEAIAGEIRAVTGIEDQAVLEQLAAAGVQADTVAALSLVPLVEVAWADARLEEREKQALLEAAKDAGIDQRHPCYELLANWMVRRPDPRMLEAWSAYVRSLGQAIGAERRDALKSKLLGRAREVAEAAGGFLGLGNKISPEEEKMLNLLERAFDGD